MGKKNKTTLLFFIFLIVISFLIKVSPSIYFAKKIALDLTKIPLKLLSLSFVPFESIISCNRSLRQVAVLRQENKRLKILLMQLKDSQIENKKLRNLLSFKQASEFSTVAANVIAYDASNIKRTLIIDKGKRHKISLADPVVTAEGMVGMVVEVGNFSSRIILINDPDFSMAAKVSRGDCIGVVSGSLGGMCKLKYLDLDEDIRVGDQIISGGRDSRFPAGIPIGEVVAISKEHSGLGIFAIVKPKVKLSSLEEVLVIID